MTGSKAGNAALTRHELDVWKLHVVEGLDNKEIAGRLTISPKTVSGMLGRIKNKLRAVSFEQAAYFSVKAGIL